MTLFQVLSKSVANALRMKSEEKFDSSIQFIEKVNDAFDILNIRYKDEGRRSRNKFKMVLASPLDWRFEVSGDRILTIDEIKMYYKHRINNNY